MTSSSTCSYPAGSLNPNVTNWLGFCDSCLFNQIWSFIGFFFLVFQPLAIPNFPPNAASTIIIFHKLSQTLLTQKKYRRDHFREKNSSSNHHFSLEKRVVPYRFIPLNLAFGRRAWRRDTERLVEKCGWLFAPLKMNEFV